MLHSGCGIQAKNTKDHVRLRHPRTFSYPVPPVKILPGDHEHIMPSGLFCYQPSLGIISFCADYRPRINRNPFEHNRALISSCGQSIRNDFWEYQVFDKEVERHVSCIVKMAPYLKSDTDKMVRVSITFVETDGESSSDCPSSLMYSNSAYLISPDVMIGAIRYGFLRWLGRVAIVVIVRYASPDIIGRVKGGRHDNPLLPSTDRTTNCSDAH